MHKRTNNSLYLRITHYASSRILRRRHLRAVGANDLTAGEQADIVGAGQQSQRGQEGRTCVFARRGGRLRGVLRQQRGEIGGLGQQRGGLVSHSGIGVGE